MMNSRGGASGSLNTGQVAGQAPPEAVDYSRVSGRFQAVINCHACNLTQIEVAIQTSRHPYDPHPVLAGVYVERLPILLVAYDGSSVDEHGAPAIGTPLELNLTAIREVMAMRYPDIVSPDGPPADGSHIDVPGMHVVAELDQAGNPTGRVTLGSLEEYR
jgi:hypothetical protein